MVFIFVGRYQLDQIANHLIMHYAAKPGGTVRYDKSLHSLEKAYQFWWNTIKSISVAVSVKRMKRNQTGPFCNPSNLLLLHNCEIIDDLIFRNEFQFTYIYSTNIMEDQNKKGVSGKYL